MSKKPKKNWFIYFWIACVIAMGVAILGDYLGIFSKVGTFRPDEEVTAMFRESRLEPDLHYHQYTSWGVRTVAILGVDPQLELDTGIWRPLETSGPSLRELVKRVDSATDDPPKGYRILDHKDRPVGILFTALTDKSIKIKDGNRIIVAIRDPELNRQP